MLRQRDDHLVGFAENQVQLRVDVERVCVDQSARAVIFTEFLFRIPRIFMQTRDLSSRHLSLDFVSFFFHGHLRWRGIFHRVWLRENGARPKHRVLCK